MDSRTRLAVLVAIIAIVVVAAAIVVVGNRDSDENASGHAFPDPIEEGDRDYPTASEGEESYAKSIETLKSALSDPSFSADDMADSIETVAEDYLKFKDWYAWVYLDYNKKPAEFTDTYKAWTNLKSHLYDDIATALKESLSGPCAETAEKAMELCGLDPETYRNYNEMTQEEKDFVEKQADLVDEYNAIMTGDYEMEYGGTTWTAESIENDATLTTEQKEVLQELLENAMYQDAADIYVELVQIRNDYAELKGYDNYADYAYEVVFARDYTPTEAKSFPEILDATIDAYVDLYLAMYKDSSMSSDRLSWMDEIEGNEFIELISPFVDSVSDEHAKLLDYLTEYDLITIWSEDGRLEGGYSAEIYTRGSAMAYIGCAGEDYDGWATARALVHEYGHMTNMCLNPNPTSCYDISEIHSQGLEALYCTSGLAGEGSRALAAQIMMTMISTVLDSGLLTELELWAYETEAETGPLTGDQVHDKFVSILESHGYKSSAAASMGYNWVEVSHLFEDPHYYISYGTSAIGAIELFVEATEDYDAAKEKYLDLLFQQGIDGYSEAVKEAGFINAFDAEAVKALLEECVSAMERVAA